MIKRYVPKVNYPSIPPKRRLHQQLISESRKVSSGCLLARNLREGRRIRSLLFKEEEKVGGRPAEGGQLKGRSEPGNMMN